MKQLLTAAMIVMLACSCADHSKEEKAAAKTELYRNRERQKRIMTEREISRHMIEHVLSLGDTAGAEYYQLRYDSLQQKLHLLGIEEQRIELKIDLIEANTNRE